ncbi:2-iminobutanoate/2-iminopropanoate deaminase [Ixodes scapularis]|uniref:2-iminobutanoate/2-iminopropanoate deaminase n=1 Tax=Ixodes scapularis TaxID=6945 RepID=UPI001A9E596A|nr:2-iminobutanoate/2-iminopropanoate deaminase [Ixodes scapularis]
MELVPISSSQIYLALCYHVYNLFFFLRISVGLVRKMSKMTREVIPAKSTNPISAAIRVGDTMYISGQLAVNPETRSLVSGGIVPETRAVLKMLGNVLEKGRMSYKNVVKCTVYLADLKEAGEMNKVYSEFFPEEPPARIAIQVAKLPLVNCDNHI